MRLFTPASRLVLLLALAIALATGCSSSDESIEGLWVLESFEVDGVETQVERGVNTVSTPWIEIGDQLTGDFGCNDFHQWDEAYTFAGGVLTPGEVISTAAGCDVPERPHAMDTENAFSGILRHEPPGIGVEFIDDQMIWFAGDIRLTFTAVEELPVYPTSPSPPPTSFGRLNCSPRPVVEERQDDTGQDPEELVRQAESSVVRVIYFHPNFWWGYDENGHVVAGAALSDYLPAFYQIWTCAGSD
jgi:heat shock protein HslJ